ARLRHRFGGALGELRPGLRQGRAHSRLRRHVAVAAADRSRPRTRAGAHRRAAWRRQGGSMGTDLEGARRRRADGAGARAVRALSPAAPTVALALTKRVLDESWSNDLDTQLELERDSQHEASLSPDYAEGVHAFLQKRAPVFTGRRAT